mmetsp:Transcript_16071/g.43807  ORF Transcript_16071/g.43807 Transcript_16071/m.43807 type:complete len:136 (-) Transcript_16071:311-718(-)|eukprot:1157041-Pelagomonas_calceolata.AAC.2
MAGEEAGEAEGAVREAGVGAGAVLMVCRLGMLGIGTVAAAGGLACKLGRAAGKAAAAAHGGGDAVEVVVMEGKVGTAGPGHRQRSEGREEVGADADGDVSEEVGVERVLVAVGVEGEEEEVHMGCLRSCSSQEQR